MLATFSIRQDYDRSSRSPVVMVQTSARATHTLEVRDTCAVGTGIKPAFQVNSPVLTAAPTVSGGVVTMGKLRVTQVVPAVASANAPKVVALKSLPDAEFASGYRVELTGTGCEFKVTLEAL